MTLFFLIEVLNETVYSAQRVAVGDTAKLLSGFKICVLGVFGHATWPVGS